MANRNFDGTFVIREGLVLIPQNFGRKGPFSRKRDYVDSCSIYSDIDPLDLPFSFWSYYLNLLVDPE
jgi:hypothetical protein